MSDSPEPNGPDQSEQNALEMAALRRFLHQEAAAFVGEDEAHDLSPVEKADAIVEARSDTRRRVDTLAERTYLMGLLSSDRPVKRARKMEVMDHLTDKARKKRNGKTQIRSDTVATLADVSPRTARTYMDELAAEVPGTSIKKGEEVGDGKALRLSLEDYREPIHAAEASPPRE